MCGTDLGGGHASIHESNSSDSASIIRMRGTASGTEVCQVDYGRYGIRMELPRMGRSVVAGRMENIS